MKLLRFLIIAIPLGLLTRYIYRSIVVDFLGVWRPIPTSEDPYREINRLDGRIRHNLRLETADKIQAIYAEGDEETARWWRERRKVFAKETRGTDW